MGLLVCLYLNFYLLHYLFSLLALLVIVRVCRFLSISVGLSSMSVNCRPCMSVVIRRVCWLSSISVGCHPCLSVVVHVCRLSFVSVNCRPCLSIVVRVCRLSSVSVHCRPCLSIFVRVYPTVTFSKIPFSLSLHRYPSTSFYSIRFLSMFIYNIKCMSVSFFLSLSLSFSPSLFL